MRTGSSFGPSTGGCKEANLRHARRRRLLAFDISVATVLLPPIHTTWCVNFRLCISLSLPDSPTQCQLCDDKSYVVHDPTHIFFKLPRPVDRPVESAEPILPPLYDYSFPLNGEFPLELTLISGIDTAWLLVMFWIPRILKVRARSSTIAFLEGFRQGI